MRKWLLAALAATLLASCGTLDDAYDNQARRECDQGSTHDRGACYDRVDQHRRERDQGG